MNKKQARDRAKQDVSCLDVGGFAIIQCGMNANQYNFVAVGGPVRKNVSPLVIEQWRYKSTANRWEKQ